MYILNITRHAKGGIKSYNYGTSFLALYHIFFILGLLYEKNMKK